METYYGHVRTPADAIILFEACRIGLLPRVQRRLSEKERQSIRSGSVFVWDEREAGMRRWTDGKSWSASRVSGSFLTYREMEGKRGGGSISQPAAPRSAKTPDSTRGGSDDDRGDNGDDGPDGYRYKPDGLMKQSFSITTSTGQHLHLISYYSRSHPSAANLPQPSTDPALRHVRPQKGLYPESTVNDQQNLPAVTRGPMPGVAYPITPHPMSMYPAPGVTHPQSYIPGYTWPPTPLATPSSVPLAYGPPFLPPLAAPNGHAQYPQYPHPHALPPPPPPSHSGSFAQYDRAHVTPETHVTSSIPPSSLPAAAPGGYFSRSPPLSETPLTQPGGLAVYGAASSDPRMVSPRQQNHYVQQANGTSTSICSPLNRKQSIPSYSPAYPPSNNTPKTAEPGITVPSIGALMNGTSTSTSGSGSPGGSGLSEEGPKDIPSEKVTFGREDARALRQLDRVFTA